MNIEQIPSATLRTLAGMTGNTRTTENVYLSRHGCVRSTLLDAPGLTLWATNGVSALLIALDNATHDLPDGATLAIPAAIAKQAPAKGVASIVVPDDRPATLTVGERAWQFSPAPDGTAPDIARILASMNGRVRPGLDARVMDTARLARAMVAMAAIDKALGHKFTPASIAHVDKDALMLTGTGGRVLALVMPMHADYQAPDLWVAPMLDAGGARVDPQAA